MSENMADGNDSPESPTGLASTPEHTSLKCLSLVARHHGVDLSVDRMVHDYSLELEEPSVRRILRIAKDAGFKAKLTKLSWDQLRGLGEAFPAIARLENGNYVIMVGLREVDCLNMDCRHFKPRPGRIPPGSPEWSLLERQVRAVIASEDPSSPYSDEQIAKVLTQAGFEVARRSVTRCRKALGLPSSRQRQRAGLQP